jgi:hypothetical protein
MMLRFIDILALGIAGDLGPRAVHRLNKVIAVIGEDAGGVGRDFLDSPSEWIVFEG